jgi:adenylate cyclase
VVIVTGLVLAMRFLGLLQLLEWAALDQFFLKRSPEPIDPRIVIVGFNEADIQALKEVPLSDARLATLITAIKQQRPRAIGLDLYRDIPVAPGYSDLVQVFKTTPNLVGIEKAIGDKQHPPVRPPPVLEHLGQVGMNDIVADEDGKIRRSLLILTFGDGTWVESLALKVSELYLKAEGIAPDPNAPYLRLGKATFMPFQANDGGYVRADDAGYQTLINFRGIENRFHTVSVTDVLNGRVESDLMRDRIVLIGATAPSLRDVFYTPYSSAWGKPPEQMTGVEIQANIASQMISAALDSRPLIHTLPDPMEVVWVAIWAGVGAGLITRIRRLYIAFISLSVAVGGLVGICFGTFVWNGWWLPVVPSAIALVSAATVVHYNRLARVFKASQAEIHSFAPYRIPPFSKIQRRSILIRFKSLEKQPCTATVLCIGFHELTQLTTAFPPTILIPWLDDCIEIIAQLVVQFGGAVDQFRGNSILAVFGVLLSPSIEDAIAHDAQQALHCAIAIAKRLDTLNQHWRSQGLPTGVIQIGIATAPVMVGRVSKNSQSSCIMIGEAVNTAIWLQTLNASLNNSNLCVLMAESTYHLNQTPPMAQLIAVPKLPTKQRYGSIDKAYQLSPPWLYH